MPRSFGTSVPKILLHPANTFGGGNYRILQPALLLRQHGYATAQAHPYLLDDAALDTLRPDAVVVQFQQTDVQIEALRRYRKHLKDAFFVYEIDDLFWGVPDTSVHKAGILPDVKERIKTAAKLCDAITVTTAPLAAEMRKLTGIRDVRVVPNDVPAWFIHAARHGYRTAKVNSEKPRIGWVGGIGHAGDLAILTEVAKLLGDTVQWVFMGMVPPGFDESMVEQHEACDFQNYPERLGSLRLDIALAPLEDIPFNHCKSDLRVLEYGAAGFPVIASDIITYQDCPHIVRSKNTPEDWAASIRSFLSAPQTRRALAERLHEWVVTERCMDLNLEHRVQALLPRNATIFKPAISGKRVEHGTVVSVGGGLPGIENYATFAAAWAAAPGAHILYVRPGAVVHALHLARMVEELSTFGSLSVMSNDCVYPNPTRFTPLDAATADKLGMTAYVTAGEPVPVPCPTGPCVLLNGRVLERHGLPNTVVYDDVELAFMDWGARVLEAGLKHVLAVDVFVHATLPVQRTKEATDWSLRHVMGWMPGMGPALQAYGQHDPLATAREKLDLAHHRLHYAVPAIEPTYENWVRVFDTIGAADIAAMTAEAEGWENPPRIYIVMPTYETPAAVLLAAIASVRAQTYRNWSLLIADDASDSLDVLRIINDAAAADDRIKVHHRTENGHICRASNDALELAEDFGYDDWVIFLDHDDVLAPHALWTIAKAAIDHPAAQFMYSDADKLTEEGKRDHPYFAPDFNYELLLAQNYVTHIAAYRITGVKAIGGLRPGYEGSQDWDLVLRYLEARCGTPPARNLVHHIPHVLYHWRMSMNSTSGNIAAKPYALEAGRRVVLEHLQRTGQHGALVAPNPQIPSYTMVRFLPPDPAPLVSIIIPTRDNPKVLERCIGSLMGRTAYSNFEVLVVDNGSRDPATLRLLTLIQRDKRVRVMRYSEPFNYARINNLAVASTTGDFVCLLNDDTEIVEAAWLGDLVGLALRPGVGAVGPKLLYPNGTVQQCGIMIDWTAPAGGRALHAYQRLPAQHPGQAGRALITQEWPAITGACLLVRRSIYEEYHGLDGDKFAVDYNDVDFCLRLRTAGYRNLVSAQAVVVHHEGVTKKRNAAEHTVARVRQEEASLFERHGMFVDGSWNRNLIFDPHMDKITLTPPAKPWTIENRERVLIVNGTVDDALQAWHAGQLPFCATLDGHHLHMTYPRMNHVRPIDMRGAVEPFLEILDTLDVNTVIFCGVGNGTIGALGFLAAVGNLGRQVVYQPTETAGFRDPYIAAAAWDRSFEDLLESGNHASDGSGAAHAAE